MDLIVDTSVWSVILRRRRVDEADPWVKAFRRHVNDGAGLCVIGPIVQELLDGLKNPRDFERLLYALDPVPLVPLRRETYVRAARIGNRCRRAGESAAAVDCLIAAACEENALPLLTADSDFARIARHCELVLLPPEK